MGKGDKRTRKGKIYRGTHGRTRPGKAKPSAAATAVGKKPARRTARRK
jgi:30S ribosomal protein S31